MFMYRVRRFFAGKVIDFLGLRDMLYVHSSIQNTGYFQGSKQLAEFRLRPGQWVIVAKASAQGYGGNNGPTDCRLKLVGTEGPTVFSDESYGSPLPLLGTSMTVLLPFKVETRAQFHLQAAVQGQLAEFVHVVLSAIRDISAI
jgi:hypothetical protein